MMRLPSYRYLSPKTVQEAAALLAESPADTMLLAGGTDLIPNMKRRQQVPSTVIGLRGVAELSEINERDGLEIGAGVTLTALIRDPRIRSSYPALWQAVAQVATPLLRNMGTIGGNLCLDTRCTYYDQSYEWRQSINFCMKKDGDTCWVAPSSDRCLAVSSTDCAPALVALDAEVRLVSASTERSLPLLDLYRNDGIHYLTRRPDEILTSVAVPDRTGWTSAYWKLRRRGSIDFPVLGVAAAVRKGAGGAFDDVRIVLGAVSSQPLRCQAAEDVLRGFEPTDDRIAEAAAAAAKLAKPMDNTDFQLHWRKAVVEPYVAGILKELRGDAPDTFGLLARRASRAAFSCG
jgi:4-hydroxybenzoyl-CoA reductase subunit beta